MKGEHRTVNRWAGIAEQRLASGTPRVEISIDPKDLQVKCWTIDDMGGSVWEEDWKGARFANDLELSHSARIRVGAMAREMGYRLVADLAMSQIFEKEPR